MSIDKSSYPALFGPTANYALLVQNSTSCIGSASISIINGNYGGNTENVSGGVQDNTNASTGYTELTTLISDIRALAVTETITGSPTINSKNFTTPGVYLFNTSGSAIDGVEFTGTLTFDGQGDPTSQFFIIVPLGNSIRFFNTYTISLTNGAQASNIFWVANNVVEITSQGTIYGVIAGGYITFLTTGKVVVNGNILTNNATNGQVQNFAQVFIDAPSALCLLKGTKLLTHRGEVAIEDITEEDQLVTYGKIHQHKEVAPEEATLEPVVWCGHFSVADFNTMTYPICFKAHSLGENLPSEDLWVSPGHGILVNNVLTFAHTLINGTTIFQDKSFTSIEYYHIKVDGHRAIQANGVLTESLNYDMKQIERRPDLYTKNKVVHPTSICMTA